MSGGGLCYGCDLAPGQTGARGLDRAEAAVVRRIFEAYAAGRSPRKIAMQLNKEDVVGPLCPAVARDRDPRPRHGRHRHPEQRAARRPAGLEPPALRQGPGERAPALTPDAPERLIVEEVPELRIVDDELWAAVKQRQTSDPRE